MNECRLYKGAWVSDNPQLQSVTKSECDVFYHLETSESDDSCIDWN